MHENEALLWSIIGEYSYDLYTLLLGDFGLTSTQLDERLRDDAPESRRIAHTLSDSHNQMALSDTVSGRAFSIWNGLFFFENVEVKLNFVSGYPAGIF